jgi:hypothetical protein
VWLFQAIWHVWNEKGYHSTVLPLGCSYRTIFIIPSYRVRKVSANDTCVTRTRCDRYSDIFLLRAYSVYLAICSYTGIFQIV